MDVADKADVAAASPLIAGDDGTHEQGMKVLADAPGKFRSQLPADGFVDGENGAVLEEDRNAQAG